MLKTWGLKNSPNNKGERSVYEKEISAGNNIVLSLFLLTSCTDMTATIPTTLGTAQASPAGIQYAFSQENQHPENLLNQVIQNTRKTLDIAIFSITEKSIVQSILDAKARGVAVRIITDEDQSDGKGQKAALEKV